MSKADEEAVSQMLKSLKVTSGARFIAGKRLEAYDKKLTMLTAFSSAYVIILTVIPYMIKIEKTVGDELNFVTVALSIIILISSLIQYSSNNTVKAELYHRSALEMNEIKRNLQTNKNTILQVEFDNHLDGYNQILQKYSINHDDVDFKKFQLDNSDMYKWLGRDDRCLHWIHWLWASHYPTGLLAVVTAGIIWLVFCYAWPVASAVL